MTGPVLTTKQAAAYVGLAPQTLRKYKCEDGKRPEAERQGPKPYKQGRLTVYYPADLDAWLTARLTGGS